jgi:hypothetical protein
VSVMVHCYLFCVLVKLSVREGLVKHAYPKNKDHYHGFHIC